MPDVPSHDPDVILARAANLRLFVVLRHTKAPERIRAKLGEHLNWMIKFEKTGQIFLSGPVKRHGGSTALDGLTIIRAESAEAAAALIQEDPFVVAGIVETEVCEWTVNEGGIPLMLTLSDSTVAVR